MIGQVLFWTAVGGLFVWREVEARRRAARAREHREHAAAREAAARAASCSPPVQPVQQRAPSHDSEGGWTEPATHGTNRHSRRATRARTRACSSATTAIPGWDPDAPGGRCYDCGMNPRPLRGETRNSRQDSDPFHHLCDDCYRMRQGLHPLHRWIQRRRAVDGGIVDDYRAIQAAGERANAAVLSWIPGNLGLGNGGGLLRVRELSD